VYVGQGGYFFSPYEASGYGRLFKYFVEYLEGSLFDWQLGDLLPSCTAGDIRVSFQISDPETVSAVGGSVETGSSDLALGYYTTSRGYDVAILHEDSKSPYDLFDYEARQAKYQCLFARAILILWGCLVSHLLTALGGRTIEGWMHKWASGIAVGGTFIALQWMAIWRMEFGTDLHDLSVILLLGFAVAVGVHVARSSKPADKYGLWGLWSWFAATAGMPPTWRASVVEEIPAQPYSSVNTEEEVEEEKKDR